MGSDSQTDYGYRTSGKIDHRGQSVLHIEYKVACKKPRFSPVFSLALSYRGMIFAACPDFWSLFVSLHKPETLFTS